MNVSIGKKIMLGFGIVVALAMGLGWYGLAKLTAVRDISSEVADRDFYSLRLFRQVAESQDDMKILRERAVVDHLQHKAGLIDEDPVLSQDAWRKAMERTQELLKKMQANAAENEQDAVSVQRRAQWEKIRQNVGNIQEALDGVIAEAQHQFELMNRGEFRQQVARTPVLDGLRQAFNEKLSSGTALIQELVELGKIEAADVYEEARFSVLFALAVVVLLGGAAGLAIHRSVTRPLGEFMGVVEQIGKGDLTRQVRASGNDELGRLGQSLNQMIAGLKDVAEQTREAAGNLNSATAEILASTQQQASGTAEQAASVQETSTTMEEVSESGSQIADRAKEVASSAEATSTASRSGIQAVQDMGRAMEAIREQTEAVAENIVALSEKTQAVGEIISTVTDIAEQSNLLALNASIESVSAGEQGQRFSVVAGEMKTLADQAKEATVQVRSILEEIQSGINSSVMLTEEAVKRVETGRQQADLVEETIARMAGSIEESVNAFQQIVGATNQQQIGFEQVNQALKDINQASNQTASSTQQLEKAAANINALGQQLQKAVERYRL